MAEPIMKVCSRMCTSFPCPSEALSLKTLQKGRLVPFGCTHRKRFKLLFLLLFSTSHNSVWIHFKPNNTPFAVNEIAFLTTFNTTFYISCTPRNVPKKNAFLVFYKLPLVKQSRIKIRNIHKARTRATTKRKNTKLNYSLSHVTQAKVGSSLSQGSRGKSALKTNYSVLTSESSDQIESQGDPFKSQCLLFCKTIEVIGLRNLPYNRMVPSVSPRGFLATH